MTVKADMGGGWVLGHDKEDGSFHVIPLADSIAHGDKHCSCDPNEEIESGVSIWVHNAKDGREAYERGERKTH